MFPALSKLASDFQGSWVEFALWPGRKAAEYCPFPYGVLFKQSIINQSYPSVLTINDFDPPIPRERNNEKDCFYVQEGLGMKNDMREKPCHE
jgi:hypothetical protein